MPRQTKFYIRNAKGRYSDSGKQIIERTIYIEREFVLIKNNHKERIHNEKYCIYDFLTGTLLIKCSSKSIWKETLKFFLQNKEKLATDILKQKIEINSEDFLEGVEFAEKIFMQHSNYKAFCAGFTFFLEENTDLYS